jgi:putative transposase
MRRSRLKADYQASWYHCYNRVAGTSLDRPFGEVEKEQFVRILHRVCSLYSVQVVSYQVMSNHFHLLVHAPSEEPSAEVMCRRFAIFHCNKRTLEPNTPACQVWQARSRDISWFMRHLQHLFTAWYNRTRPVRRRGSLWADRFKNTLLESGAAVWACWKYIENNPVRAGMVNHAADYRFCSHGIWHQTGRHPFAEQVGTIVLPMLQDLIGVDDVRTLRDRMDQALADQAECAPKVGFSLTVQRRVRHWTSSLIIGSKTFLLEVMSRHHQPEVIERHRPALADDTDALALCAWRKLRIDLK